MANIQRICPVCGSVSDHRRENDTRCLNCQEPLAFVQQFGGEEAYGHWKREMEAKKEARLQQGRERIRKDFRLELGADMLAFVDQTQDRGVLVSRNRDAELLRNVKKCSISNLHMCLLHSNGTVSARGNNDYNQCLVAGVTEVADVLAAPRCSYFVHKDGTVSARGSTALRQQIENWTNIQTLACGDNHLVGLTRDGRVLQASPSATGRSSVETALWQNVVAIAAAIQYTLGLHSDGKVSYAGPSAQMQQEVAGWENVVAIAADTQYAIGLTKDGRVLLAGKCAPVVDMNRSAARQWTGIANVAAGRSIIAAVTAEGKLQLTGNLMDAKAMETAFDAAAKRIL